MRLGLVFEHSLFMQILFSVFLSFGTPFGGIAEKSRKHGDKKTKHRIFK